jgi:hypothetical protein
MSGGRVVRPFGTDRYGIGSNVHITRPGTFMDLAAWADAVWNPRKMLADCAIQVLLFSGVPLACFSFYRVLSSVQYDAAVKVAKHQPSRPSAVRPFAAASYLLGSRDKMQRGNRRVTAAHSAAAVRPDA